MENSPKEAIYRVLRQIPHGQVATYGQIAKLAGLGNAARFVGTTLKNLPSGSTLPWHRVVNSRGTSSFPVNSEPYLRQLDKLTSEGVEVSDGKLSLIKYRWHP